MKKSFPASLLKSIACSLLFIYSSAAAREATPAGTLPNTVMPVKHNILPMPGIVTAKQQAYAGKPLSFLENKGQVTDQNHNARPDIQYSFPAGNGLTIFISNGSVHYQFAKASSAGNQADEVGSPLRNAEKVKYGNRMYLDLYRMDVELVNANKHAKVSATEEQAYYENYISATDLKNGRTAHAYNKIVYENVYPHIDWVLYSANGKLKHEFKVHKGGKVSDIRLKYSGATDLKLDNEGTLVASTPQGMISEPAPVSFQEDGKTVSSKFRLNGNVLSYEAGRFSGDLTIDPYIGWSTYYGGAQWDKGDAVVTDNGGYVYMSGTSSSIVNIATWGAYISEHELYSHADAFLVKFNSDGVRQWGTYYEDGPGGDNEFLSLVRSSTGILYAAGYIGTDVEYGHRHFAYVSFTSDGYPTGGDNSLAHYGWWDYSYDDFCEKIAVDASGNVYLTGYTNRTSDFASTGAYQTTYGGGNNDAFVMKYNSSGTRQWVTYFGGSGDDKGYGIATDGTGNVYITGYTTSSSGIATSGSFMGAAGGSTDAFLAKFNSSGSCIWATYYGGTGDDVGSSVAVDSGNYIYVCGSTNSSAGISTSGAFQVAHGGGGDFFLVKFDGTGARQWGTYFGGTAADGGTSDFAGDVVRDAVTTDHAGNVYLSGATYSSGLATAGAPISAGATLLAKFNTTGARLWATYFGGSSANGLTVDNTSGNMYMAGYLYTDHPTAIATPGAHQYLPGGYWDAYLVQFRNTPPPITGFRAVCIGSTITLTADTAGGTWGSSNTSLATVGSSTGVVSGLSEGTITIFYTRPSGSMATYEVNVDSASAGDIIGESTACAFSSSVPFLVSKPGGTFTSSNTSVAVIIALNDVYPQNVGTTTISYRLVNTCGTFYSTKVFTVNPYGSAGTISGTATFSVSATSALSSTVGGGTWSSSNTSVATVGSGSGIVSGVAPGTARITYFVTGCGAAVATTVVTVTMAAITGTATVCTGATTTLSNVSSGGTWSSSNTAVATVGSTGIVTGVTAGTATISYTIGTIHTTTIVTVSAPSSVGAITGASIILPGATAALNDTTAGGTWSSSNTSVASISSSGVVLGLTDGTAVMSYTVSGICGTTYATKVITVHTPEEDAFYNIAPHQCEKVVNEVNVTLYAHTGDNMIVDVEEYEGIEISSDLINWHGLSDWVYFTNSGPDGFVTLHFYYRYNAPATIGSTFLGEMYFGNLDLDEYGGGPNFGFVYVHNTGTLPLVVSNDGPVYEGGTVHLSTYTDPGAAYAWSGPAGFSSSLSAPAISSITSAMFGAYSVSVTTGIGCTASGVTTVAPATPITGTFVVCTGSTTALADAAGGGTWSSSNTSVATIGSTGIVNGIAAGTARITYTASSGGFSTVVVTVNTAGTIYKDHELFATGDEPCLFSAIAAHDSLPGGTWSASGAAVTDFYVEDSVFYVFTDELGPADIFYTLNGCVASYHTTVNLPTAHAEYISNITTVQTGATADLPPSSSGGIWVSYDPSIATTSGPYDLVTGVAPGVTMVGKIGPPCLISELIEVDVTDLPPPPPLTGDPHVCIGATTVLADSIGGGSWYTPNTAIATVSSSGVVTGVAAGTAVISYRTLPPDYPPYVVTMVVTVSPTASVASIAGTAPACIAATGTLSDATSGGVWSSSNTAVVTVGTGSGVVTGIGAGTAIISYTVTNSCGTVSATRTVTINAFADAGTISGTATVCAGSTTTLADAAPGGAWSSSNTTVATVGSGDGAVTGVAGGTASISYTVTNSCGTANAVQVVTVNPLASVGSISGTAAVCTGATTTLTNTTGGGAWSSSNPAIATIGTGNGVVTGIAAGTAIISYTVTNGCGSVSATQIVTVSTAPVAGSISGTAVLCAVATTTLTDAAGGGAWSSSNTAIATAGSASGIITGVAAGTAAISYTVTNICGSAYAVRVVTVNPLPAAITGVLGLCTGSTSALSCATPGGTWSSSATGVATVSTTGLVTAVGTGNATISYTPGTGCSRTVVVSVSPVPSISGTSALCVGNSVTLTPSVGGGTWASSVPSVANVGVTTGIVGGVAAGSANITYAVSAYCKSVTPVTVSAALPAISGAAMVCNGSSITLSDATTGGSWSSSNTAIATVGAATGIVSGIVSGTVTITYATGSGCRQTKTITVGGGLGAITGATGLCVGATSTYISTSPSTGTGWSSSNASVASVGAISGVVTGVAPGTAAITFTPYSFSTYAGCVAVKVVTVDAVPSVAAITGPAAVQVGHTITLADVTPGGVWSSNNTARATVSSSGVVTGVAVPAATISYSVTNGACVYAVSKLISVMAARPEAPVQAEAAGISVYPNPTSGTFTLSTSQAGTFVIYTMNGKEVQRTSVAAGLTPLSLPRDLAAGIYMCRFNGEDGSSTMVRLVYE